MENKKFKHKVTGTVVTWNDSHKQYTNSSNAGLNKAIYLEKEMVEGSADWIEFVAEPAKDESNDYRYTKLVDALKVIGIEVSGADDVHFKIDYEKFNKNTNIRYSTRNALLNNQYSEMQKKMDAFAGVYKRPLCSELSVKKDNEAMLKDMREKANSLKIHFLKDIALELCNEIEQSLK